MVEAGERDANQKGFAKTHFGSWVAGARRQQLPITQRLEELQRD